MFGGFGIVAYYHPCLHWVLNERVSEWMSVRALIEPDTAANKSHLEGFVTTNENKPKLCNSKPECAPLPNPLPFA